MKVKRILGVLLAVLLIASSLSVTFVSAQTTTDALASEGNAYNLAETVGEGNILHAFNWRFCDVEKYMKDIASAGYTAVQVSPVQGTKVTTNCGIYACDWWSFYQPINFKIGNALGSEADFKSMCDTAHSYGVKVIVDIVANHVAQADSGVSGKVNPQVDKQLQGYVRNVKTSTDDTSRANMVQRTLGGIPDLITSEKYVQLQVLSLLEDCVDNGADGFRFDAAKHIETPDDGDVASDFWPTVIDGINSYKDGLYIYGEILSDAGKFDIASYTKYMNITNFLYGSSVRSALKYGTAKSFQANNVRTGTTADQNVYWIESHDNFCDGSSTLTEAQLIQGWAAIAARKDSPSLFLARPSGELASGGSIKYDQLISESTSTWKSPVVAAVNNFKNAYIGESEATFAADDVYVVTRATDGAVVVALKSSDVSIQTNLADGKYFDSISAAQFTVENGILTGTVPTGGVAVLYAENSSKAYTAPSVELIFDELSVDSDTLLHFATDTVDVKLYLDNASSGTYSVDGGAAQQIGDGAVVTLGQGLPVDSKTTLTVTATQGDKTATETYTFYKKDAENNKIYFDNSATKWSTVYAYPVDINGEPTNGAYPGVEMTFLSGKTYVTEISPSAVSIKFNEGYVTSTVNGVATENCLDGRTVPSSVLFESPTDAQKLTGEVQIKNGYYEGVLGSMIWSDGSLKDNIAEVSANILGDADQDGKITIVDATSIQKHLAKMGSLSEAGEEAADVDLSTIVNIVDATWIQKKLAGMECIYPIGQPIGTDFEDPNKKTTVTLNAPTCYKDAISINAYYWGAGVQPVSWPGVPMTKNGDTYTVDIEEDDITTIIFVGVYDSAYKNCIKSDEYELQFDTPYTIETMKLSTKELFPTASTWEVCNAHMWSGSTTTEWPGISMTKDTDGSFYIEIPANVYANVIFSRNGSKQSKTFAL